MEQWTNTRPANAAPGTTHTHNGVTYVARHDAGQTVWDVNSSTDPHASSLVKKFSAFNNGAGDTTSYSRRYALIDRNDNARVLGETRHTDIGQSHAYQWANMPLPDGARAHEIFDKHNNIFIITTDGKCYASGHNDHRQMARVDGSQNSNNTLVQVNLPADKFCKHVSIGSHDYRTAYYLMTDGSLYGAGHNPYGMSFGSGEDKGTNINEGGPEPQLINTDVKTAYLGGRALAGGIRNPTTWHATGYLLKHDGFVYTTGDNRNGQRGTGDTSTGGSEVYQKWHQVVQGGLIDQKITRIKVSHSSHVGTVYALTDSNRLYSWGYNGHGQLGRGNTTSNGTPYLTATEVEDFWCPGDTHHGCVWIKKTDGTVHSCGYNGYGQLGIDNTTNKSTFTPVIGLPDVGTAQVESMYTSGYDTAVCVYARTTDNRLFACGYNGYGQLGLGHRVSVKQFTQIRLPIEPVQVRCYTSVWGNGHGAALIAGPSGELYGCGDSTYSLFDRANETRDFFTKVNIP